MVQGQIGVPEQATGPVLGVDAEGDSDAGAGVDLAPFQAKGLRSWSTTRSATSVASLAPATSSSITANSSPPRRATVSSGRMQARRLLEIATNNWSPASWPRESLTRLKSSRSTNRIATAFPRRSVRVTACPRRSINSVRFGRSVRGSWNARCSSCLSKNLRPVASRMTPPRNRGRPFSHPAVTTALSWTQTVRPSRATQRYSVSNGSPVEPARASSRPGCAPDLRGAAP
jgi:hypothetical protein